MMLTIFNKLDQRQKILLGILVVVLLILIWQLHDIFSSKSVVTPPVKSAVVANNTGAPTQDAINRVSTTPSSPGAAADVDPTTNSQAEYLRLVNEYQMAQLQRMIAEDNEAIAVAKRNAAQAMADTAQSAGGSMADASSSSDDDQASSNTYVLVYTGQQSDGQWTATLKKNGQSYDVVPGRQLPDGSQVTSIDENGVLLSQNQGASKLLVTFSGATVITNNGPQSNNVNNLNAGQNKQTVTTLNDAAVTATQKTVVAPPVITAQKTPVVNVAKAIIPVLPILQAKPKPVVAAAAPKKTVVTSVNSEHTVAALLTTLKKELSSVTETPVVTPVPAVKKAAVVAPVVAVQKPAVPVVVAANGGHVANTPLPALQKSSVAAVQSQIKPGDYTIQLSTDRKLADAQGFINKHQLKDKVTYFHHATTNGGEWFVAVYGQYPNRKAAQTALDQLPAALKAEGAYVVSYADVGTPLKE